MPEYDEYDFEDWLDEMDEYTYETRIGEGWSREDFYDLYESLYV